MIRLFLALRLHDTALSLLSSLGQSIPGARPVPTDQLHLTVRFIGEIEFNRLHDIHEGLILLDAQPVELFINGVGHFPPRGSPRILWAGISPTDKLTGLRNKVNLILRKCGVTTEIRKYHPHITLARVNSCSPGRVARFLAENNALEIPPFIVDKLSLFSSVLTPKGAVHTLESEYLLGS